MSGIETAALAAGMSWASGFRLYAALFIAGLLGRFELLHLPAAMDLLSHPLVLVASGLMALVEFMMDKTPGVDSVWDSIHTFIRIPAGAVLAYAAVSDVDPAWATAAAIIGGTIAAGTHLTKAGTRMAINTSPEPFTNWGASFAEDAAVVGGLALLTAYPLVFLGVFSAFVLLCIWWLPKVFRFVRKILRKLFGGAEPAASGTVQ